MSDDMGTAGEAGVTMLLIVLNRTLGLPVLLEQAALVSLTELLKDTKISLT